MNRRVLVILFVAFAICLGYASWRGWLPGVVDYGDIEPREER